MHFLKTSAEKFLTGSVYSGWEWQGEICSATNDIYCFSHFYKANVIAKYVIW